MRHERPTPERRPRAGWAGTLVAALWPSGSATKSKAVQPEPFQLASHSIIGRTCVNSLLPILTHASAFLFRASPFRNTAHNRLIIAARVYACAFSVGKVPSGSSGG